MKQKILIFILTSILSFSCESDDLISGSDKTGTKSFDLEPFSKISHNVSFPIFLAQDPETRAQLTGNINILDYIDLRVEDQTLFVEFREGYSFANMDMTLKVQVPELTELEINSSGDALITTAFNSPSFVLKSRSSGNVLGLEPLLSENLTLESKNSGDLDLLVLTTHLTLKSEGTSQIQLKGAATSADLLLRGTSDFKGVFLDCQEMDIYHESTGNAEVFVNGTLEGVLASTGNLLVRGHPDINVQLTGTGELITLDL